MPNRNKDKQYIGFRLDGGRYALPIDSIREIVMLPEITPVPSVPEKVLGVANLRGSIIPIVSMRLMLGLPPREIDDDTRTIVLGVGDRTIGCTVDQVSEVLRLPDDQLQPPPESFTASGVDYIAGLAQNDGSLVIVLEASRLLGDVTHRSRDPQDPQPSLS